MTAESTTNPKINKFRPQAQVRFPLRAKITIPYLLLAVVLAIGAAYVVMRIVFDTADERFSNQLIETGKLCSEWMVREENRLLKTLRMLTFTEGMADAMVAADTSRLGELAIGIAAAQGEEEVILLNTAGQIMVGIQKIPGGSASEYQFQQNDGTEFASTPFVKKVIATTVDDEGDKFSGLAFHDGLYDFFVSGPLRSTDGKLVGVVLVGKSLNTIVSQLREETLAQVSLYDTSGKLLATTLSEPQSMSSSFAIDLIADKETSAFTRKLNEQRTFSILDLNYTELLGAWQIRNSEVIGLLGASMINNYWIAASIPTRIQVVGLASLLILLVLVVGVEIADRITYPLQDLVAASSQVAAGNLDVRLPPGGNDEVGYLTGAFNKMVADLDKSRLDLIQAYDETIAGWATMLDQRDQDTEGHTRRVTELTLEVTRRFGLSDEELIQVRRGALLHDIGKMSVPDRILKKTGKLTTEEWKEMRMHPQAAYDVLFPIEYLRPALDIPYAHHERWDGSGYPRGLTRTEIPLAARIFSVVDVWDAMTSDRPYRPAMSRQDVIDHIFTESGQMFDPQVVEVFWSVIRRTYPDLLRPGVSPEPIENVE